MITEFKTIAFFLCMFSFIAFSNAQKGYNKDLKNTSHSSENGLVSLRTRQDLINDSLKQALISAKDDDTRFSTLINLCYEYTWSNADIALIYAQQQLLMAAKLRSERMEAEALKSNSLVLAVMGNYVQALDFSFRARKIAEKLDEKKLLFQIFLNLCIIYRDQGDYEHAIHYGYNSKWIAEILPDTTLRTRAVSWAHIGSVFEKFNHLDSALFYTKKALAGDKRKSTLIFSTLGNIYSKTGNYPLALDNYRQGIPTAISRNRVRDLSDMYNGMAKIFIKKGQSDSGIYYAKQTISAGKLIMYPLAFIEAGNMLADIYKRQHNMDSALKYLELTAAAKDSLFNNEKLKQVQNISFSEQLKRQEIEVAKVEYNNRIRVYGLLGSLAVFILMAIILFHNNRNKQKANDILKAQKQQIDEQRSRAEQALKELKATQSQLIQSEKMASLGELTAGIAHEIQNPLNFVNNFSEVNTELVDELEEEVGKGNMDEIKAIAKDIKENEQKINFHGKRADAIVKGMLQHSRANTGKKEPTDINALADEYLRLSYHGLRAKDKSFNAGFTTDFYESIGKINVVPQDIGRVLLNLFNNAFHAVNEKKKQQTEGYEPVVSVTTKKENDKLIIVVGDNGVGISKKAVDKIFQPFFTTKPTGQGTGLGLSLSYDIIKAHGGELKVETKEGEGAVFIIQLPFKSK